MSIVLLTGFEPFGGDAANPSGDAVRILARDWDDPRIRLVTEVLPVTFGGAGEALRARMAEHRPDVVIATGLAGNRAEIGIERIAVNLRDARIPDNAGTQPADEPVVPDAPLALASTLPVKAMARAVADAGVAASVSLSAGTFVCNDVFYTAVDAAPAGVRPGFIHVPWDDEHAPLSAPSLPLADIVRALEVAIRTAVAVTDDDITPGGAIS